MLKASCHCGNVQIEAVKKPDSVLSCNCSVCGRFGAIWAYYEPEEMVVTTQSEPTKVYNWGKKDTDFHHCPICGCMTHYNRRPHVERQIVAVNTRMASREDMDGIPVAMFDGADSWEFVEDHPGWGGF